MKKSDYTRKTRRCKFNELRPEFVAAVRQFAEDNKLDGIEGSILHCFETASEKQGFLGKRLTQYTDMAITPEWLFWGVSGDKQKAVLGGAKLKDMVEIIDYEKDPMSGIVEDHGLRITGFLYQASRRSTWFIGLGDDAAGGEFRQELRKAAAGK